MCERALQPSKDSYCTRPGNYKGNKNPYKPYDSKHVYRSSLSQKLGFFFMAVRKWICLGKREREGTKMAGISLANRSV